MTEFIYLHGFASGPNSNKATAFKKRFEELKVPICVPDLQENDFENLNRSYFPNIDFTNFLILFISNLQP